jgi:hypothetical protein
MPHVHDHPPDAFDHLLDSPQATRHPGNPDIAVIVSVPVSAATLASLTERAAREGRDVADIVAEALRAAAA